MTKAYRGKHEHRHSERARHVLPALLGVGLCCVALLAASGCARFGEFAKRRADKAAYRAIADKQDAALGKGQAFLQPFALDAATTRALAALQAGARRLNLADAAFTSPTYALSLSDALAIAVANNRDYKTTKEELFSKALGLLDARWNYGAIFTATGSVERDREDSALGKETYGSRGLALGVKQQLATGAEISLAYTHQFIRLFSGGSGDVTPGADNALSFSVVQPLLRGAGSLAAREPLRQSERDMIYAARSFKRYEESFVINIITNYFGLLSAMDEMDNARANCNSVRSNYDLLQIQVRHRVRSRLDADQALQKVLAAQATWINAQASYRKKLDQFKYFLGVDLSLDVGPDRRELEALRQRGTIRPDMTLGKAIEIAMKERLDYKNGLDAVEDKNRGVKIKLQNFLPSLNARYSLASAASRKNGLALDLSNRAQAWGLDLDLPLDWTLRRDAYRQALLDLDQARRAAQAQRDQVIVDVRDAWREMDRLSQRVAIAQQSVDLARRRVEGTQMMLAAGQTTAREMADTQDEFLAAQNDLTSVLIDHTLARLGFWRAIGRLKIADAMPGAATAK